jgi:serine/threonine protein kinase
MHSSLLCALTSFVRSDRPVAIKVISLDPANRGAAQGLTSSILTEIRMAKRLAKTSPHIVHMFDFDFDPHSGRAFIVMELGQGDLEKTLKERSRLNTHERKAIWKQLVHIAVVLDQRGIVTLNIDRSFIHLNCDPLGTSRHQTSQSSRLSWKSNQTAPCTHIHSLMSCLVFFLEMHPMELRAFRRRKWCSVRTCTDR